MKKTPFRVPKQTRNNKMHIKQTISKLKVPQKGKESSESSKNSGFKKEKGGLNESDITSHLINKMDFPPLEKDDGTSHGK